MQISASIWNAYCRSYLSIHDPPRRLASELQPRARSAEQLRKHFRSRPYENVGGGMGLSDVRLARLGRALLKFLLRKLTELLAPFIDNLPERL